MLNVNDTKILKKIALLLDNENVVWYDMEGNPISEKEYVADIQESLRSFREGNLETYSTQEVRKQILD